MFEGKSLDDYQREKRRIPRYELLYRLLLDEMIALPPEVEYLPYQEELANQFHLSRNTVRKTMAKLRSDGYICTRKKSGSRILKRTMEEHRPQVIRKTFHNSAGFLLANNVDDPHIKTSIRWDLVNEVERQFRESGMKYALLPVWMLSTRWKDQNFLFAMNGQTGKLVGDLPVDKGKYLAWFAGIALPLMAAILGFWFFL